MANYIDLNRKQFYEDIDEGKVWDYVRGKLDQWTGWGQDSLWVKGKRRNYFGLDGKYGIGYDGAAAKAWGTLYGYFYESEGKERRTQLVVNALRTVGTALNSVAIEMHKVPLSKLDSNDATADDESRDPAHERLSDARTDFGIELGINGAFGAYSGINKIPRVQQAKQKVRQKVGQGVKNGYNRAKSAFSRRKTANAATKSATRSIGGQAGKGILSKVGGAFSIMGVVFEVWFLHDLINAGINWIKTEANKGNPAPVLKEAIIDLRNFFRSYGGYMNMGHQNRFIKLDSDDVENAINVLEYATKNTIPSYEEWCDMMKRKYPNMQQFDSRLNWANYYNYYHISLAQPNSKPAVNTSNNGISNYLSTGNFGIKPYLKENVMYNSGRGTGVRNQRTFLLTENEIRKIVSESTVAVLNEGGFPWLKSLIKKAIGKRAARSAAKREAEILAKQQAEKQAKAEAEAAARQAAKGETAAAANGFHVVETQEIIKVNKEIIEKYMADIQKGTLKPSAVKELYNVFGGYTHEMMAKYFPHCGGVNVTVEYYNFARAMAEYAEKNQLRCPFAESIGKFAETQKNEAAKKGVDLSMEQFEREQASRPPRMPAEQGGKPFAFPKPGNTVGSLIKTYAYIKLVKWAIWVCACVAGYFGLRKLVGGGGADAQTTTTTNPQEKQSTIPITKGNHNDGTRTVSKTPTQKTLPQASSQTQSTQSAQPQTQTSTQTTPSQGYSTGGSEPGRNPGSRRNEYGF